MRAPGHRFRALGELTDEELAGMLKEDETLFVEHKAGIEEGEGFQVAKAAASFANTLGGWVLVGVTNCKPNGWIPPEQGSFVDAVRERLDPHVTPLPSFAAAVRNLGDDQIGVIRIYESA